MDLTVYPSQQAAWDMHAALASRVAAKASGEMAYVMPLRGRPRNTPETQQKFGSSKARCIFEGGGPLLLRNEMTSEALERLGYLDGWSPDPREAIVTFCNSAGNKWALRKLGLLPSGDDSLVELRRKLRAALLSPRAFGTWEMAPSDGRARRLLLGHGFLASESAPREEVRQAMLSFFKAKDLPAMTNYSANVWQMDLLAAKRPDRREVVRVKKAAPSGRKEAPEQTKYWQFALVRS
ncbi:unnamed protein product [Effrenium voratum]|nr:unnamed protein product [Effrenium voratum]